MPLCTPHQGDPLDPGFTVGCARGAPDKLPPLLPWKADPTSDPVNTILNADCIAGMNALQAGSVDLVFADPPFNIGYDYDVYNDSLDCDKYIHWCRDWMQAVHRALADNGTFWLAIGDEYAAELKIEAKKLGFHCRSWVIWYYIRRQLLPQVHPLARAPLSLRERPGQLRLPLRRTREPRPLRPSARLRRRPGHPRGRLPDDTWILRPTPPRSARQPKSSRRSRAGRHQ